MPTTVHYSPQKLLVMAAVCALLLPLLSPIMLLTGPGAILLVPLLLIGGPICAIPCLVRAVGDRRAVVIGPHAVTLRTLWRTIEVPLNELVGVRLEVDTVRWMLIVPVARKRHLVLDLEPPGRSRRSVRLPMNLLDLDEQAAAAFVERVTVAITGRAAFRG